MIAEDVLAILRQHNERVTAEVSQATQIATHAAQRAEAAVGHAAAGEKLTHELVAEAGAKIAAIESSTTNKIRQLAAGSLLAGITSLVAFLLDRAPALLSLVGGWVLWRENLSQLDVLKLVGFTLYGLCIVGPAAWISYRRS